MRVLRLSSICTQLLRVFWKQSGNFIWNLKNLIFQVLLKCYYFRLTQKAGWRLLSPSWKPLKPGWRPLRPG